VAIKVLSRNLADQTDFRRRFEREAQVIAALDHPNIVQVFDFGVQSDIYYMVMEFIDGQSLSGYLRTNGALPLDMTFDLIRGVADALDYAHEQGLVHRDVKPSNVLLQPIPEAAGGQATLRPVLTDFGLAKMSGSNTSLTQTGVMGTLGYIAPEQITSSKTVDARADIYALGVMAYQVLTNQLPFRGDNPAALLIAHLRQPPPDPRVLRPDLSGKAAEAVMKAMAKESTERFATAGEFSVALAAATG
jgi:serine/threonine-protein kinase